MTVPLAKHGLREPEPREAHVRVAVSGRGGHERNAADLLVDAARVAARLPAPTPGSHVLLAVAQDRYAFATGLLGAWSRGHAVALPPHTGLGPILRLSQHSDCAAVVHDTITRAPLRIHELLAEPIDPAAAARIAVDAIPEHAVTLYVTGPDGEMRGYAKCRSELLGEAERLAELFHFAAGLHFASTLAPCTQFGFMLGVLVPLVSGGVMLREIPDATARLPEHLDSWRADVLVSVPAHLRQLGTRTLARYATIVSSRAPLEPLRARLAHARVIDLFGTTATGSVAQRQGVTGGAFEPLPGVRTRVDAAGRLVVEPLPDPAASAQNDPAAGAGWRCQDRVAWHDGRFELRGRADEPERTAEAAALEAQLTALDGVEDAAVVAAPTLPGMPTQLLAAVVAVNWSESRLREALGPSAAVLQLKRVPTIWRGSTGKPRRGYVFEAFGRTRDGAPLTFDVLWQEESSSQTGSSQQRTFQAIVPEDYAYFAGHFPGYPILPGAAQLSQLIIPCVRRARPQLGPLNAMSRIKFLDRIQPGQRVQVVLTWPAESPTIEFALRREQILCAAGRLTFGPTPTP